MHVSALALAVLVTASAASVIIPVLRRTEVRDDAGQYAFGYETGNGITVVEQGALKKNPPGDEYANDVVMVQKGSFSYMGPDGRRYTVSYLADENGFQPTGDHFPEAPTAS